MWIFTYNEVRAEHVTSSYRNELRNPLKQNANDENILRRLERGEVREGSTEGGATPVCPFLFSVQSVCFLKSQSHSRR